MKTVIIGIGGVGGFFGGMLARKYSAQPGHEVHFVARGKHLEAIKEKGLTLQYNEDNFNVHPTSSIENSSSIGIADLVMITTKSYDLGSILPLLKPICGPQTIIIALQNGMGNIEILKGFNLPGILCDGLVYVGSEIKSPGVVKTIGATQKIIFGVEGSTPEFLKSVETYLAAAGFQVVLTDNPLKYKWLKFQFICSLSAVTALHQKTIGQVLENESLTNDLIKLMDEIALVAKSKNIGFPDNATEKSMEIVRKMGFGQTTSFQRDYLAGKNHELENYLGVLVREAADSNIKIPVAEHYYLTLKK